MAIVAPTDAYPYPSLAMDPDKVVAQTQYLIDQGVTYKMGAKAEPLGVDESTIEQLDCSGFARLVVFHATKAAGEAVEMPDGSANQHAWCDQQGFKVSDFDAGHLQDNAIRIAFLSPADGGGVGHVMLIVNGLTCESHGSKGADRRAWGSSGFMQKCSVYVLTPAASTR